MRKTTSLREYSAPELEVISTVVEQGFTISADIQLAAEDTFGDF